MTEASVWLSQCFSDSCTTSFAFLSFLLLLFFLSSWDWLIEDLYCEAHLQRGRVIVSLWQRSFVWNRWRWVGANSKLCVVVTPPTSRVFIRVPHSVIYTKENMKLTSGKEVQKTSELVPDPSEVQVSVQASHHCPFLLAHGAQWDSSPTKSL